MPSFVHELIRKDNHDGYDTRGGHCPHTRRILSKNRGGAIV